MIETATARLRLKRLLVAASAALTFLALANFPGPAVGRQLDTSWSLALGYLMRNRLQAGVDYAFTYGPLGYLAVPVFVPGLFWLKYFWAIIFAAATTFVLVRLMMSLPRLWMWVPWLWLVVTAMPDRDTKLIFPVVGAAFLHIVEEAWASRRLAFTSAWLVLLGLVKVTLLALGAGCLLVMVLGAPAIERRRVAKWLVGCYGGTFVLIWLVSGQSLGNVPRFLAASFEAVRGHSEAMALVGSAARLSTAFQIMIFLAVAVLLVPPNVLASQRRWSGVALLAGGLLLSWKEGFVRQDPPHETVFFAYAAFAALLLCALDRQEKSDASPLRFAFLAIAGLDAMCGLESATFGPLQKWWSARQAEDRMGNDFAVMMHPRQHLKYSRAVWLTQQERWGLPAVRKRVGRDTIDVTSYDQSTIFWNGLNWHPRPAFQGYAAYTPELAKWNAEFLSGPNAPRYVLALWMTIDDRFPAQDDGLFLIELLRRYRPALSEREYILLEQRDPADIRNGPGEVLSQRTVPFGEVVHLDLDSADMATLSVHLKPSAGATLRRLFFRSPKIQIRVLLGGEREPRWRRYEIIPTLAESEFVVNPLVEANVDFYPAYGGSGRRVAAFRLVADTEARRYYGASVDIVLKHYPGVLGNR
jgi:hypothetical protein